MARRKINFTKLEITQTAIKMFLEYGYSFTSPRMICDELDISPGSLTYYYPTKEDLFTVLIKMLTDFQWNAVQKIVDEGETPITALCFELTAMAAMCEEDELARDLYISAYTSPKTLAMIRESDTKRAKKVFAEFCGDWTDAMFAEAETLVSGIEYGTLAATPDSPSLELRIAGAMKTILGIYNVPEDRQELKVEKALGMDYRKFGKEMLNEFKKYVLDLADSALDDVHHMRDKYIKNPLA